MERSRVTRLPLAIACAFALGASAPAGAAEMSDAWITTKVKIGLLTNEGLATVTDVDVDTVDGRVTLHGAVPSAEAKAEAERVARSMEGVREVRNLIEVESAAARRETAAVGDDELRRRVEDALARDAALADSQIRVRSVEDGVVVLGGEAHSLSTARRAIEDARAVDGVRRVANEIESPDRLTDLETWREGAYDRAEYAKSAARDLWVTSATKARLIANAETPAFDINVDTHDGVVTLFGTVDSEEAKRSAEAEARRVEGVERVVNALQVVAPEQATDVRRTDEQLDQAIEQRLEASGRIGAGDIDVEVENSIARLQGTVSSRDAELMALAVARSTQGVRRVIDELEVEAGAR